MEIKGIGEKTAALFQKLNIETVGDLLLHYPRTYVQFPVAKEVAEVTDGETAAVLGRVRKTPVVRRTRSMPVTVTTIGTDEAELELVWFRMPYIKSQLAPGNTLSLIHISEPTRQAEISYAVFCLKKKKKRNTGK